MGVGKVWEQVFRDRAVLGIRYSWGRLRWAHPDECMKGRNLPLETAHKLRVIPMKWFSFYIEA